MYDDLDITIGRNRAEVLGWLGEVGCDDLVAVDTETTGLDPHADGFRCRLFQVAHRQRVLIADLEADPDLWHTAALRLEELDGLTAVGWNLPYDAAALYAHDPSAPLLYDTGCCWDVDKIQRVVEPLTNLKGDGRFPKQFTRSGTLTAAAERAGVTELAEADHELFQVPRRGAPTMQLFETPGAKPSWRPANRNERGKVYRTAQLSDPKWVRYCALDPAAVLMLWQRYTENMGRRQWRAVLIDREVAEVVARNQIPYGMATDMEKLAEVRAQLVAEQTHNQEMLARFGCKGSATTQVKPALQRLGAEGNIRGDTGKEVWDMEVMQKLAYRGEGQVKELASLVIAHRSTAKRLASYVEPMMRERIYPEYRIPGTLTGRWSASNPPVQQLPGSGPYRSCLVARPGRVLIDADYDQLELRILGVMCYAQSIYDDVVGGQDMHRWAADQIWGEGKAAEIAYGVGRIAGRTYRDIAKRALYGWIYGATAASIYYETGVSRHKAGVILETLRRQHPKVHEASEKLNRQQFVDTIAGRRIPLIDRWQDAEAERLWPQSKKAMSWMVQGSSADIVNLALLRWWQSPERHPDARLWLAMHDQLIVEVPESEAQEQLEVLLGAMELNIADMPFTCSGASILGSRWG